MDRRSFLSDLSRYAFVCAAVPGAWPVARRPRLAGNPFTLGVASGDPTADACVIWTRLAPDPLAPLGGMERVRVALGWEVAHDEAFAQVVRLRTMPAVGAAPPLDFAFASCQHWEQGLYTALEHMSRERVDLVAFLGDYIYEGVSSTPPVRTHWLREVMGLDDYRGRYAQYRTDPALQAAHARCPWILTWGDHEVDNNYAGLAGENAFECEDQMRARRAAGYQAWWENQPVRAPRARSCASGSWTRVSIGATRRAATGAAGSRAGSGRTRRAPCWATPRSGGSWTG